MLSRIHRLVPIAFLLLPCAAMAQPASATDITFEGQLLNSLHEANLMEIAAGRLGIARGTTPAVRQYAAELVKDHSMSDDQVAALATKMNVPLPSTGAPDNDGLKQLSLLSGNAFDRAFLKMMVEDHAKAITLVRNAQPRVSNAGLTAFLNQLLPTLESHLATATALSKGLQS